MSYLTKFKETLADKLSALPEAARAEIVAFAAEEVLTSYRNGLRDAEKQKPPREGGLSSRGQTDRTTPRERRTYQQR